MKLTYTVEEQGFRLQVRQWLVDNPPKQPLNSFDTQKSRQETGGW